MAETGEQLNKWVRARRQSIVDQLSFLDITFDVEQVLQIRYDAGEKILVLATSPKSKLGILVTEGVEGLIAGQVRLDLEEKYDYANAFKQGALTPTLRSYSYTLSYMQDLTIDPEYPPRSAAGSWGELLLTQRKHYRFDGPEADWDGKPLSYQNAHPRHHLHAFTEEYLRFPVAAQPSLLAVCGFAMVSFDHDRWLAAAKKHPRLLTETQTLLPHLRTG